MALSENHKKRFQLITSILLALALALMTGALILQSIPEMESLSERFVYAGALLVVISTPIRLLGLTHMYFAQGERRVALSALLLVIALAGGAIVKWALL